MSQIPPGVAAGHPATAQVGAQLLSEGGNAVDAAVGMILAGCVAETIFTGMGGGGFATMFNAATGQVTCLDFFVSIPGLDGTVAEPGREIAVSFNGVSVPYAVGGATVAIPGTPAGTAELHRRGGRLPWAAVLAPVIELSRLGAAFPAQHAGLLSDVASAMLLDAGIEAYSVVEDGPAEDRHARPGAPEGRRLLGAGEPLYHEGLADTLARFAAEGERYFYTGDFGKELVAAVRADGGAMSLVDLAAYRVRELPPRRVRLGQGTIHVRGNDLDNFAGTVQALDQQAVARGGLDRALALVAALRNPAQRAETTSLVAADADGNVCAATHSLGLGSGIWVGGVHGNSMLGEGELLRGDLIPGQRMPSMMVPLVALDEDGQPLVAGGAAGGSRIRPALLQVMSDLLVGGRDVAEAVAGPRLSATSEVVHLEPGFAEEVYAGLAAAGAELVRWDQLAPYFGGVSVAARGGLAADPRRGGQAIGC